MMGIEQINTIEIFKIDDTARISIPSYINIPDDAKPAKVLEFLNSATILRPPHFYFGVHEPGESRLAVHLIVDYPRDICISYAAYIVGRLHHTSSIVLSNKVDVSTLRRLIAKDLERKEDLLQLYSAWDGILTNTDDNKLRAATLTVEGRIPLLGHTILSEILPLKIKRHIDVIVYIDTQPNLGDIPAMPTATEELLQLLEEQEFTRREHEEANRRLVEKVGQLRGLVVREKAERRHEGEQRAQVQDERQQSSQEGLAILMKQDKLEIWREAEETAKAVQGSKKDVEGESCEPRKASDSTDFLKAMVDEQRRQTDLLATVQGQQTDLLTGMLAEQRQNAEWARQHGQNVEKLLQQLVRKVY